MNRISKQVKYCNSLVVRRRKDPILLPSALHRSSFKNTPPPLHFRHFHECLSVVEQDGKLKDFILISDYNTELDLTNRNIHS